MTNWKTTTLGVLTILGSVVALLKTVIATGTLPDVATLSALGALVTAGWQGIHSADAKTVKEIAAVTNDNSNQIAQVKNDTAMITKNPIVADTISPKV